MQLLKINPDEISDKKAAEIIRILLQIIEILYEENQALKAELQKMRDELNQLKGEQGKPKFPHINILIIILSTDILYCVRFNIV